MSLLLGQESMSYSFKLFWLILVSTISTLQATTLIPTTFDIQLRDADAIVEAKYLGHSFKRLTTGEVFTEAKFEILKSAGLSPSEIHHPNQFRIFYPGGEWRGQVVTIQQAPKFISGERVVLLLEKRKFGFMIQNLTLGKYSIHSRLTEPTFISSTAFPGHSQLGKISWSDVDELVKKRFGSPLVSFTQIQSPDRKIASIDSENTREVASEKAEPASDKNNSLNLVWIVLLFSTLGMLSVYMGRQQKGKH